MNDKPELKYTSIQAGSSIADLATAMYAEFRTMPPSVAGQVLCYLTATIFINTQFKDASPVETFDVFADGVRKTLEHWIEDQG